ncbi:helix-turn-helix domain-containing protein [Novosphingobium sp. JCM 18896]|uniref:helix-turn-helix domain-containing protein n=1 Tax=Novosphingobium sp. JCM 18896 TaxID=2989731 RepID=UPI0022238484|nr:AraC family transcriptional regulator [Novosphingobium sp. JCM 18896]
MIASPERLRDDLEDRDERAASAQFTAIWPTGRAELGISACPRTTEFIFSSEDHCLVFLIGGGAERAEMRIGEGAAASSSIRPGSAWFIPAGQTVRSTWRSSGLLRYIRIFLSPASVCAVARVSGWESVGGGQPDLVADPDIRNPEILRIAAEIGEETRRQGKGYQAYLRGLAQCLVVQLVRDQIRPRQRDCDDCIARRGPNAWRIRRAIEAMEARISESLSIDELSRVAGLSPFHFSRQFKLETGRAPNRYLVEIRIERAKLLLVANLDWPLPMIAEAVGYRSASQFSAVFRRETGRSPGAFRQGVQALSVGTCLPGSLSRG